MYGPCQLGKQLNSTHKVTTHVTRSMVLELLHMDLWVLCQYQVLVVRITFLYVLMISQDIFPLMPLRNCVKLKNEKDCMIGKIIRIQNDYSREFENTIYVKFCNKYGVSHEFSAPKTP